MHQADLTLLLPIIFVVCCLAVPTEKKPRYFDKTLSDEDHEDDGHNPKYDHDAFLGHDEKEQFDQLSPEESKRRLAIIFEKIDADKDGFVTEDELRTWIQRVQKLYIINDTERMWKDHQPNENGILTWGPYQKRTFGYEDDPDVDGSRTESYREMILRDMRRWNESDTDKDGGLSKDEFVNFLHPEDADHMRDIVVMETIEDIDKDNDGFIDIEEYIADLWDEEDEDDDENDIGDGQKGEPEWVTREREQFEKYRDKDHDGKLNHEEIKDWIIPEDYDHSDAEAKHLISSSDSGDKDGKLDLQEILDNHDLFVGSQATDFGEALTRHDEF